MTRSESEVERLVRENQKLVHYQVNRFLKRRSVGDMEREDLVSWGLLGLVQAARAWDPERAGSFATVACKAIAWMLSRGVSRDGRPNKAAATVSLDDLRFGGAPAGREERLIDQIPDEQDVERELLDRESRAALRLAVAELPPPLRRLIERRFFEEVPVATLAEELGLSRAGVFLRQRSALRQLRAALPAAFARRT